MIGFITNYLVWNINHLFLVIWLFEKFLLRQCDQTHFHLLSQNGSDVTLVLFSTHAVLFKIFYTLVVNIRWTLNISPQKWSLCPRTLLSSDSLVRLLSFDSSVLKSDFSFLARRKMKKKKKEGGGREKKLWKEMIHSWV